MEATKETWNEYDSCARWCAQRGISGAVGSPLPDNLSAAVVAEINNDIDAFVERVNGFAYAMAMEKHAV